ncbi:HRDC domain-containing protein [Flavobacterium sp.]|uniref:HRDC domain-containing protein n=1 Tax=Flavobacterium sp. TaxID=239 RepID=UPI003750197B
MQVKLFNIRLDSKNLEIDQNSLNDFLETINFKKSDTHFIESESNYWSVLVHYEEQVESKVDEPIQLHNLSDNEQNVYNNLKNWRSEKAEQLGLKNFMICHNSELINIAITKPNSISELKKIKGFGNLKSEKFGDDIISLLNAV